MSEPQGAAVGGFAAEVAGAAAVGLVVAALGTLVIGLSFSKAPVIVASIFCAAFAKVALELSRRAGAQADDVAHELLVEAAAETRPAPMSRRRTSLASGAMATRPPAGGAHAEGEDAWRFHGVMDDDSGLDDLAQPVTRRPFDEPPRRTVPSRPTRQASSMPEPDACQPPPAPPAPPAPDVTEQLDHSLDRFGEHLVGSLNQLFDEYVGEALSQMQSELSAERKDLSDLRAQLKAIVKAGARREEVLRDELASSRDAIDDLRGELEALREEIAVLGAPEPVGNEDVARLAEEVRALRKRVPFQSRRPTGGGLEDEQIQAVADAVADAILQQITIQPQ